MFPLTGKSAKISGYVPEARLANRQRKYQLQLDDATKESAWQKIAELEKVIEEIGGKVDEYDDALVRKLIKRITVYDVYFTVEFKSGIKIDVRL